MCMFEIYITVSLMLPDSFAVTYMNEEVYHCYDVYQSRDGDEQ